MVPLAKVSLDRGSTYPANFIYVYMNIAISNKKIKNFWDEVSVLGGSKLF